VKACRERTCSSGSNANTRLTLTASSRRAELAGSGIVLLLMIALYTYGVRRGGDAWFGIDAFACSAKPRCGGRCVVHWRRDRAGFGESFLPIPWHRATAAVTAVSRSRCFSSCARMC
jgi:hypothetical protein